MNVSQRRLDLWSLDFSYILQMIFHTFYWQSINWCTVVKVLWDMFLFDVFINHLCKPDVCLDIAYLSYQVQPIGVSDVDTIVL